MGDDGGYGNDSKVLGEWTGPETDGVCDYHPKVNVKKNARKVVVTTKIQCLAFGTPPRACGSQLTAFQNTVGDYSVTDSLDTCNPDAAVAGKSSTQSCYNPADCTGGWTAEAGVYIDGPLGSNWQPHHSSCRKNGTVLTCDPIIFNGRTVS